MGGWVEVEERWCYTYKEEGREEEKVERERKRVGSSVACFFCFFFFLDCC